MESDHEQLHRELESEGDDLEQRRDELKRDTDEARQDIRSKVSDQRVPGVQDDQQDVLGGKDAVEEAQADGESPPDESDEGDGSEGAGHSEDEE